MANGNALFEGLLYLAYTYCNDNRDGVQVILNEHKARSLSVSLLDNSVEDFPLETVEYMEALGFEYYPAHGKIYGTNPYQSYFALPI